jgi:hypothetical protein
MSIPNSHTKERLSIAYLSMVAAQAGAACHDNGTREYGTDAIIMQVRELPTGKFAETGYLFRCQLKATSAFRFSGDFVIYEMEVGAYNKIVSQRGTPCLLILFCLPEEIDDWLNLDEQRLIVKRCCYWAQLSGPESKNARTVTIKIPRSQVLTAVTIGELLEKVARGELR